MSEVAGRLAIGVAGHWLMRAHGGRGVLLGGVPGVPPARVAILGCGTVGLNAARTAAITCSSVPPCTRPSSSVAAR